MERIREAVRRPLAALVAALGTGDAYPGLLVAQQPLNIASAIGLVELSARAARTQRVTPPGYQCWRDR